MSSSGASATGEPGGMVLSGSELQIIAALSLERFAPYLRAADGDPELAIRIYEWNIAVSGALYEAIGLLEVVLRNSLSDGLDAHHGSLSGHWYDDPRGTLSTVAHQDIAAARNRARAHHRPETPGRVIAELDFCFWKSLLSESYETTLWASHLRHCFPHLRPQNRSTVYAALDGLHTVKNRIARHEPIHDRDLRLDTQIVDRVFEWIDADVRTWAATLSRTQPLIPVRPSAN